MGMLALYSRHMIVYEECNVDGWILCNFCKHIVWEQSHNIGIILSLGNSTTRFVLVSVMCSLAAR